jgi:endonuclease/exonuclease/phosphatase family metal-dependent hydrolase
MQQEIRFATFNTLNLAPPGVRLYDNLEPATAEEVEAKIEWTARQIDLLDADVIGFQEVFSQALLKQVLSRTRNYRDAIHVGFDPAPGCDRLKPMVALVSRLPLAGPGQAIAHFPEGIAMPDAGQFARPPVHASVIAGSGCIVDVIVVHLKSKRPDYRTGDDGLDPTLYAMACLRSLVRRGAEAVALHVVLSTLARENKRPQVVLGDFNDVADAVTTGIVLGLGAPHGQRMYDAFQIQSRQDHLRNVAFSSVHEGQYSTIDHIMVSGHFHAGLPGAIGEVLDVIYLNDHLVLCKPDASDHGQVVARIRLNPPVLPEGLAGLP